MWSVVTVDVAGQVKNKLFDCFMKVLDFISVQHNDALYVNSHVIGIIHSYVIYIAIAYIAIVYI